MATLKEALITARSEPNSERSMKLKAAILAGKMDSRAHAEGLDLSTFKAKFGAGEQAPQAGFLQKAAGVVADTGGTLGARAAAIEQAPNIPEKGPVTAESLANETGLTVDKKGQVIARTPKEVRSVIKAAGEDVDIKGTPSELVKDIGTQAIEGTSKFFGGAKEQLIDPLAGKQSDVAGAGFRKMIEGGLQTAFAPISGVVENVPGGEKIAEVLSQPREWAGDLYQLAAKKAGVDTETEAFQEARKQIMTAFDVGTIVAGPKVGRALKNAAIKTKIPSFGGKKIKQAGTVVAEQVLPTATKEAELVQKFAADKTRLKQKIKKAKTPETKAALKAELESLKSKGPRTVAQTAVQRDIAGGRKTVGRKAEAESSRIFEEEINPALKESGEIITKDELFKPLKQKIEKTVEPGRKKALQDAFEAIDEEYADFDSAGLDIAQQIKSELDEFTPQKAFKGKEIASEYNQLRHEMANGIRRQTYDRLKDIDMKNKYLDYVNLQELKKLGVKARTQKGGVLKPGGTGTLIRDIWDMVATPIGTRTGQFLYKIGDILEFESKNKVKTFGEYVQDLGIDKQTFDSAFLTIAPAAVVDRSNSE